jgi:flagellar hook-length control protein FliK
MVETVNAQTLPQSASGSSSVKGLEPGAEIKAKVETNLSGGVVRLATESGKIDLRVPNPLPVGADVSVTVTGTKQHPSIQIASIKSPDQATQPTQQVAKASADPGTSQIPGNPQSGSLQSGATAAIRPLPALTHLFQAGNASPQATAPGASAGSLANSGTGTVLPPNLSAGQGGAGRGAATAVNSLPPGPSPSLATGTTLQGTSIPSGAAKTIPPMPVSGAAGSGVAATTQTSLPSGVSTDPAQTPLASRASETGTPLPPSAARTSETAPLQAGRVSAPPPQAAGSAGTPSASSGNAPQVSVGNVSTGQAQPSSLPSGRGPIVAQPSGSAPLSSPSQPPSIAQVVSGAPQSAVGSGAPASQAPSAPLPSAINPAGQTPLQPGPQGQGGSAPAVAGTGSPTPLSVTHSATEARVVPAGQASGAVAGSVTPATGQSGINLTSSLSGQQHAGPSPTASSTAIPASTTSTASSVRAEIPTAPNLPNSPATRAIPAQPYPASRDMAPPASNWSSAAGNAVVTQQSPAQQAASVLKGPLAEQQAGLGNMFAQVGTLASAQATGKVSMPDPVVKAMQQILGLRLNTAQMPTGKNFQQAVRFSGQFREAQLALPTGGAQPLPDLKSMLISFKSLLQQLGAEAQLSKPANQPPVPTRQGGPQSQAQQMTGGFLSTVAQQNLQSLLKETDSALARIRLTQLVNSGMSGDDRPQATSRPMDLVVELPLSLGQETALMQMQIGRDGSGSDSEDEDEQSWRLRFSLDLTATGPLEAAISLRGGGTFASLWVDRKETFDNLNAVRETMEAAFADAGLDLQELRLIRGLPPKTAAKYGALINRQS